MEHYHEMFFNNIRTGYITSSKTYKLFPARYNIPAISDDDHTIMRATDLLEMFKIIVSVM